MKNILIYQEIIPHYRRPIFEELGKRVNLTVFYTQNLYDSGRNFQAVKFRGIKIPKFGYLPGIDFVRATRHADVLIAPCSSGHKYINYIKLFAPKIKLIRWGIGVRAGYNIRYDSPLGAEKLLDVVKKSDAALFYSDYPKLKYEKMGVSQEKLFVANNTVVVNPIDEQATREKLLFVGSLYPQKRVDLLLEAYAAAYKKSRNIPDLIIVGDGSERKKLESLATTLHIMNKVAFVGQIEKEAELVPLFSSALACISPDQAGLSVLKAMGYGVPFVTLKTAITGGEIFNIKNGVNGVLLDSIDELTDVILDVEKDRNKYLTYGNNAYAFYHTNRLPSAMVDGFMQAIDYVTSLKQQ